MWKKFLAELLVTWFPGLKTKTPVEKPAKMKPIDRCERWPTGRRVRQCVEVFDPKNDYRHTFIKSGFEKAYLVVYEDCTYGIDVKYITEEELPKNLKQWFE